MLELGALHCNAGAEEMRRAETAADFARAADWFKSALRLDPDNERAEAALEAAVAAQQSLSAPPLYPNQSPTANLRMDHFGGGFDSPGKGEALIGLDAEMLRQQLERNQTLLSGSVADSPGASLAADAAQRSMMSALADLRDELRCVHRHMELCLDFCLSGFMFLL